MPHYEDIEHKGGLGRALQDSLSLLSSPLRLGPSELEAISSCYVREGDRYAEVSKASDRRLFLLSFSQKGTRLAHGRTHSIHEVASAFHAWLSEGVTSTRLASRFAFVEREAGADLWEQGKAVESKWLGIKQSVNEMGAFVDAALQHPVVGKLFPFIRLGDLHLSRCTGYPYSEDCPSVKFTPEGFVVRGADGKTIGGGTAAAAIEIVARNLPKDCGPAIYGTADDLAAL